MTNKSNLTRFARAHKQRGVSLPLVAIVIAISLLLGLAALIFGPRYITQAKADNFANAIQDLKGQVVAYGGRVGVFTTTNVTPAVLVGQGVFPRSQVTGTAAAPVVTHEFGGILSALAVGTTSVAGDSIIFTFNGIPQDACALVGSSMDDVASQIVVGSTTTKAVGARTVVATLNTACAAGNQNNVMAFQIAR
ncbi:MAG: hypothetical protein K0M67_01275 [Thiobacillus sp.]|nr:hypothetical protein [Thiobacillus sp.]